MVIKGIAPIAGRAAIQILFLVMDLGSRAKNESGGGSGGEISSLR